MGWCLDLGSSRNIYCSRNDLTNEASVETFFISRLLKDLGYKDSQIKTKQSIEALVVNTGRKGEKYKPDYALIVSGMPRCVIDAKGVNEPLGKWVEQCSGYCLALNRKYDQSNPVSYFILSNGISTSLYEWDKDRPVLTLDFADFNWGNPKYEELKKVINAQSIIKPSNLEVPSLNRADFPFHRPTSEHARQLFTACHRAIWKSEVCSPSAAFMEFVKIMFIKLWCDRNLRENKVTGELLKGANTDTKLPKMSVTFSVDWIESREADGALNPLDTILFERLRNEIEQNILLRKKKRLFDKDEKIQLRSDTVKDVVSRLQHYDMFGIDEDLNGRLFETFLSATMRGRELGQFFTPRSVVKMMTYIAELKANRNHQDKVMDACCGSGGFLIEALTVMRNQIRENVSLSQTEREELINTVCNECIYGIDYGKDPPLARIARINMYLHGDGGSRIYYADGLDKQLTSSLEKDPEIVQNIQELRKQLAEPLFDVVLTNPPFSMAKEQKNETERRILKLYNLARKDTSSEALRPSLRSSIMFLERYWDLLRPGGQLITVIDDTILGSSMFAFARNFIRERFLIRAIISLPGDTFRRSGSRVKTSVLVLEKKRNQNEEQPACFAFFSEYLGIDDLTPRASDTDIQEARTLADTEIKQIVTGYEKYLTGVSGPLILQPERISDRLDLKYCVPQLGRLAKRWQSEGIEVKRFSECVTLVEDTLLPAQYSDTEFTLIKVTYNGECEIESVKKGKAIKAKNMYRVKEGQMVFSTIRATDGAIAIVPKELDGALVSNSYSVFKCGTPEDTAYLWAVLRSHEIRADMQSLSPGSGRYTTYWPDVGIVSIPWLSDQERKQIGESLINSWELERRVQSVRDAALSQVKLLGVESEESIKRWRASKAPT